LQNGHLAYGGTIIMPIQIDLAANDIRPNSLTRIGILTTVRDSYFVVSQV